MSPRSAALAGLAMLGVSLRLLGVAWGLPDHLAPGEPPFHPDEFVPWVEAARLYAAPHGATFIWGGGFYMRLAWVARLLAPQLAEDPLGLSPYAAALLLLRLLNAILALGTAWCAGCVARALAGSRAGVLAGALALLFPGPVLDAHFARPDVFMSAACGACLALSLSAARSGRGRALFAGAAACGAATATMLSGVIGLAPLAWACFEGTRRSSPGPHPAAPARQLARRAGIAAAGLGSGYAACNTEALLHPAAFRAGLAIAFSSHQGGSWAFPTRLLGYVPLYAFGTPAALAALLGVVWLARRRPAGAGALLAQLGFGALLLGRVGFDMMRHLEFVAAAVAAAAAIGLERGGAGLARWLRLPERRGAALAGLAAAAFTLQLSLGYVLPMQLGRDARYRSGLWLAENAPPGSRVGITQLFAGDRSFGPRAPASADLRGEGLMLKPEVDAGGFLDRGLDFIATTDYGRDRARGASAQAFLRELFAERTYRLAWRAEPELAPPFLLADLFSRQRPADLYYTRASYYVFQRRDPAEIPGPPAAAK